MQRIGVYAGAFDPVHSGHISFALQAMKSAQLDNVYFLPERQPRDKEGVTHFAHRVAMLRQALMPYPNLHIVDLPDRTFTVQTTWPRLTNHFPEAQLCLLMGSDVIDGLPNWPQVDKLFEQCELVVGLRNARQEAEIFEVLRQLPTFPPMVTFVESKAAHLNSSTIRRALRNNLRISGVLTSVARYARAQWLYVSLSK